MILKLWVRRFEPRKGAGQLHRLTAALPRVQYIKPFTRRLIWSFVCTSSDSPLTTRDRDMDTFASNLNLGLNLAQDIGSVFNIGPLQVVASIGLKILQVAQV